MIWGTKHAHHPYKSNLIIVLLIVIVILQDHFHNLLAHEILSNLFIAMRSLWCVVKLASKLIKYPPSRTSVQPCGLLCTKNCARQRNKLLTDPKQGQLTKTSVLD